MKSTDLARRDRDLKKARKKEDVQSRKSAKNTGTVGEFINDLHDLFFFDAQKIYNIDTSEEILELLEDMKEAHPEKQWENIIRKAVKKTKTADKEGAIKDLMILADL